MMMKHIEYSMKICFMRDVFIFIYLNTKNCSFFFVFIPANFFHFFRVFFISPFFSVVASLQSPASWLCWCSVLHILWCRLFFSFRFAFSFFFFMKNHFFPYVILDLKKIKFGFHAGQSIHIYSDFLCSQRIVLMYTSVCI